MIESLLGLSIRGDSMRIDPKLPSAWPGFVVRLNLRETNWKIEVVRGAKPGTWIDGKPLNSDDVPLGIKGSVRQLVVIVAG